MADNLMLNVSAETDLNLVAERLAETYRMKGFQVSVANLNNSVMLTFDKGTGGINTVLGMGLGIKVTLSLKDNVLMVNYSEAEWTSKIIGIAVGWFLCLIPFITGIVGAMNQSKLPKEISNDITMIVG